VLTGDVGPFSLAHGNRAALRGINLMGLRRAATSRDDVRALLRAFRRLFGGYGTYFAPRESGGGENVPGF
jgi:UDP-N-acetylglucosamine acyltransferase